MIRRLYRPPDRPAPITFKYPRTRPAQLGWLAAAGNNAITALIVALAIAGALAVGVAAVIKPPLAIGLVVAVGLGLALLRRLDVGGLVLITAVPILSGLRRGLPIPRLRLTEALVVAIASVVLLSLRRLNARPWTRVEWTLGIFVACWIGLGVLDARILGHDLTITEYGTVIGPLQFFLLYRSIRLVLPDETTRLLGLKLFLLSSVPVSVLAVLQQAKVPGVRDFLASYTGSDVFAGTGSGYQTFARATGPFPHWTPLSGYLLVVLLTGIALYLERSCAALRGRPLAAVLILDALALLFSGELSAIFGLLLGILLIAAWTRQLRRVLRIIAVAVVVFGVVSGPYLLSRIHREYSKTAGTNRSSILPQSVEFRFQIWSGQYFPAIGDRPLEGYGVVNPSMVTWPATESQYVTLLEWGGIPLFAAYFVMLAGLGTAARSLAKSRDPTNRVTGNSVLAVIVVLIPMGIVFPFFEDSGLPQALWVLAGIMMAGVPGRLPRLGRSDEQFEAKAGTGVLALSA